MYYTQKHTLMSEIHTTISTVRIDGQFVRKTFVINDDDICGESGISEHATTELFILNLLDGCDGFPTIINFEIAHPNYTLVLPYLGKPLTGSNDIIDRFIQILKLTAILHKHHIIHCDLKPDNILIDEKQHISIIDFTHSTIASRFMSGKNGDLPDVSNHIITLCTYPYASPESYTRAQFKTYSHDIWSLGCVLYELMTGVSLFDDRFNMSNQDEQEKPKVSLTLDELKQRHKNIETYYDKIRQIDQPLICQILLEMLNLDPLKRPSAIEILKILGVVYEPPTIFSIDENNIPYYPHSNRLRCFNLPPICCHFVDNLIDYITSRLVDHKYGSGIIYSKKYEIESPLGRYPLYDIYYTIYALIGSVCGTGMFPLEHDGNISYRDYMDLIWCLIRCYRMSIIFRDMYNLQ
jgi:serine/threonine protein kinase